MKLGKLLLVGVLLTMMIVPQIAWAGKSPVRERADDASAISAGTTTLGNDQDERGLVRWFGDGTLFWWQLEAWARFMARWNRV